MNVIDKLSLNGSAADSFNLEQLQGTVNRYCHFLTGSSWDAEDLAQETWVKAFRTLQHQGHMNPEAFMLRIAKNVWVDQARRKTVMSRILMREQPAESIPDNTHDELEAAFLAIMRHLSPLQRTVFLLRDVFGYSIAEAAERLKISTGAVKSAHHRARRSLEAVKDDLRHNSLPAPKEEHLKAWLHAIASAYRLGDIATLVELVQQNEVDPVSAIGVVQSELMRKPISNSRSGSLPTVRMAA